jgi:peptidyl-tRNA hydrolase
MGPGKAAAQAGHAFIGAFHAAEQTPEGVLYRQLSPGTKVCLQAGLKRLYKAYYHAQDLGMPCFLVEDSGCANFYGGQPTITALGIGPAYQHQIEAVIGNLQLY